MSYPIAASPRFTGPSTMVGGEPELVLTFPVQNAQDIVATRTRAGVTTTMTLDGEYSVTDLDVLPGAKLLFTDAALAGDIWLVIGLAVIERPSDYLDGSKFNATSVNAELDKSRIIEQEIRRDVDQAVKLPFGVSANFVLPLTDGYGWVWSDTTSSIVVGPSSLTNMDNLKTVIDYGAAASLADNTAEFLLAVADGKMAYVPGGTFKVDPTIDLSLFWGVGDIVSTADSSYLRRGAFFGHVFLNAEKGGTSTLSKINSTLAMMDLRLHEDASENQIFNFLHRPDPAGAVKISGVLHCYGDKAMGPQFDLVSTQAAITLKQARNWNIVPEYTEFQVGSGGSIVMARAGDGSAANAQGSPFIAQARTVANYGHDRLIADGLTFFNDHCLEYSGTQTIAPFSGDTPTPTVGNGVVAGSLWRNKEAALEVTGVNSLYLQAKAQVWNLSPVAFVGHDFTSGVPPNLAPAAIRHDVTNLPWWYNPVTTLYNKMYVEPLKTLRCEQSFTKTFTGNAYPVVELVTAQVDDFGSSLALGIFTVPVGDAGVYEIGAGCNWTGALAQESVRIKINGAASGNRGYGFSCDATWRRKLNDGDTIQVEAYNAAGGSNTLTSAYMEIVRLGDKI